MPTQNTGSHSTLSGQQNKTREQQLRLHPVMEQLILDHKNLARLIKALEDEFHNFILDKEENDEGSLSILLESMDYINVYPQTWHHPVEEEAFKVLLSRNLEKADIQSLEVVKKQHHALEKATRKLQQSFDSIAKDSVINMNTLVQSFCSYIDLQREHMETENTQVFPLMMAHLDTRDWKKISATIIPRIDPLFKKRSENEYLALAKLLNEYESKKE